MKIVYLILLIFSLSCTKNLKDVPEPENSNNCLLEADFSGIVYQGGCTNSFAERGDVNHILYIESIGSDRRLSGTFYLDNFDLGTKVIQKTFTLNWRIGPEGTMSPASKLDKIILEITSNSNNELSGYCFVPFDDQGFTISDTLQMNFGNIVIRE